jgi:hypothetical protein
MASTTYEQLESSLLACAETLSRLYYKDLGCLELDYLPTELPDYGTDEKLTSFAQAVTQLKSTLRQFNGDAAVKKRVTKMKNLYHKCSEQLLADAELPKCDICDCRSGGKTVWRKNLGALTPHPQDATVKVCAECAE